MTQTFECTQCGKCCHDLNLPLTVKESVDWISNGNMVKLLVEAIPWSEGSSPKDALLSRKKQITFAALSGSLSMRVQVTFLGYFSGACPHLGDLHQCSIYEHRPLTCRIYPFEMNPHIALNPDNKLCPSEAWGLRNLDTTSNTQHPLQISIMDKATAAHFQNIFTQTAQDVAIKERVCACLGIRSSSLSNEGYLFHHVDQAQLRELLQTLATNTKGLANGNERQDWRIYSPSDTTRSDLSQIGAYALPTEELTEKEEYFHFR